MEIVRPYQQWVLPANILLWSKHIQFMTFKNAIGKHTAYSICCKAGKGVEQQHLFHCEPGKCKLAPFTKPNIGPFQGFSPTILSLVDLFVLFLSDNLFHGQMWDEY